MTLEQLRIFVAVAEKQHVTQAAGELNLTQSATSAAVAALEERYGIKLFDRVGCGIVLTHTGRTFLTEARAVLARAGGAEQVHREIAGLALAAGFHESLNHRPYRSELAKQSFGRLTAGGLRLASRYSKGELR